MSKRGARLTLPRDLSVAYTIGRMGAVVAAHVGPLFWGSAGRARLGLGRLVTLGIIHTFARRDPSHPHWYSLTTKGVAWVVDQVGCADDELRRFTGLSHVNLDALGARNSLWSSLSLASRASECFRLDLVCPEWELRRAKSADVQIVPDVLVRLAVKSGSERVFAWMVELDSGSMRLLRWRDEKARHYALARRRAELYGEGSWAVLAIVPSWRRARTVAQAVVDGGAGAFTYLGTLSELSGGQAFAPTLSLALDLVGDEQAPVLALTDLLLNPDQRVRSAADRGSGQSSPVLSGASHLETSGLSGTTTASGTSPGGSR